MSAVDLAEQSLERIRRQKRTLLRWRLSRCLLLLGDDEGASGQSGGKGSYPQAMHKMHKRFLLLVSRNDRHPRGEE